MPSVRVLPYLQARPDRAQADEPLIVPTPTADLQMIRGWDPATPISVRWPLRVDRSAMLADTGVAESSDLKAAISWECAATMCRASGPPVTLSGHTEPSDVELAVDIDAGHVAQRITLHATVYLAGTAARNPDRPAPTMPGSVLWRKSRELVVEGSGARFPMETIDFGLHSWLPPKAGWYLEWNPDAPDNLLMGTVRLLLNAGHPAISRAVHTALGLDDTNRLILQTILWDVGRTMIRGMLGCRQFVEATEPFEKGTVGHHVRSLLTLRFRGDSLQSLAQLAADDPGLLDARLQAGLNLYDPLAIR